jgi:hypothetical protein
LPVLLASIGAPSGDDAVKRSIDFLVGLKILKPFDVGGGGIDNGFFGIHVADDVVCVLPGDRAFLFEIHHAPGGDLRQIQVGLSGLQIGLGLLQLMVHFGRLDLGQKITRFHARADIGIPLLQIAVGARINGRVDQGLGIAGQHQFLCCAAHFRMDHGDSDEGRVMCFRDQRLLGRDAARDALIDEPADRGHCDQDREDQAEAEAAALFGRRGFGRRWGFVRHSVLCEFPGFFYLHFVWLAISFRSLSAQSRAGS